MGMRQSGADKDGISMNSSVSEIHNSFPHTETTIWHRNIVQHLTHTQP